MRIGELSKATGVSARMVRYYEEMGLIAPSRAPNGYRDFDDMLVERVKKISALVESGMPMRLIRLMMPCLHQQDEIVVRDADPQLRELLVNQRDIMTQRIAMLEDNRAALDRYIAAMDETVPAHG